MAQNVKGLVIDAVKTLNPISSKPVIDLNNVENAFVYNCNVDKETAVFLNVGGSKTKKLVLRNNNLDFALKPIVKTDDVQEHIAVE